MDKTNQEENEEYQKRITELEKNLEETRRKLWEEHLEKRELTTLKEETSISSGIISEKKIGWGKILQELKNKEEKNKLLRAQLLIQEAQLKTQYQKGIIKLERIQRKLEEEINKTQLLERKSTEEKLSLLTELSKRDVLIDQLQKNERLHQEEIHRLNCEKNKEIEIAKIQLNQQFEELKCEINNWQKKLETEQTNWNKKFSFQEEEIKRLQQEIAEIEKKLKSQDEEIVQLILRYNEKDKEYQQLLEKKSKPNPLRKGIFSLTDFKKKLKKKFHLSTS